MLFGVKIEPSSVGAVVFAFPWVVQFRRNALLGVESIYGLFLADQIALLAAKPLHLQSLTLALSKILIN